MPVPPFTTSKFQQDASRKLGMSVKRAMMLAQHLYEGVGLGEAKARSASSPTCVPIHARFRRRDRGGARVHSARVRQGIPAGVSPTASRQKQDAQGARSHPPSSVAHTPDSNSRSILQDDEYKVYKLIWQRFVASQMTPAVFDQTTVDIDAATKAQTITSA
jgi:DNA topoisomerase-1